MATKHITGIVAILALGLAACGGDDDSSAATTAVTTVPETTEAPTTTEPSSTVATTTRPLCDDGEENGHFSSHKVCKDGQWVADPVERPPAATLAPTTTTAAPTTTLPPTTLPPTPEQQFIAATKDQTPERYRQYTAATNPQYLIDYGRRACNDAAIGMAQWGERTDLTGAQVLAWVWEVKLDHESARLARLAVQFLCPENQPVLDEALGADAPPALPPEYYAGVYLVGTEIQPGVYEATGDLDGCYWERQDANGEIIDNNFISAAKRAQVTIKASDYAFMTEGGCGGWLQIG